VSVLQLIAVGHKNIPIPHRQLRGPLHCELIPLLALSAGEG